jgi:hypothetical protein
MRRQRTVKNAVRSEQPTLFGGKRRLGEIAIGLLQPFAVDGPNLAIDRIGDLTRRKGEPRLVIMATAHTGVGILKNMIAHIHRSRAISVLAEPFRRRMTLTSTQMLIQREKNVKDAISLKVWSNE